jgi:hypothetical protein
VGTQPLVFRRIAAPRQEELQALGERIAERIGRALERQGVFARVAEIRADVRCEDQFAVVRRR